MPCIRSIQIIKEKSNLDNLILLFEDNVIID